MIFTVGESNTDGYQLFLAIPSSCRSASRRQAIIPLSYMKSETATSLMRIKASLPARCMGESKYVCLAG